MAVIQWVTIEKKLCELSGQEVALQERRLYPVDALPDTLGFQVIARRCSVDLTCNMAGYPCKWAYTNPTLDPFAEQLPAIRHS
jgi:hypothetical protein